MSKNEKLIREILNEKPQDILRFLGSIVKSKNDAEDLFQTGAIRLMEKSAELKDESKAFPWILSVYRNLALDFLRSGKITAQKFSNIEPEELENIAAPVEEVEAAVCGCGKKLMKQIPKQYSSLLEEVDMNGESVTTVAMNQKTTPNNISVRLRRARKSLKKAVQDHCEIETFKECVECDC